MRKKILCFILVFIMVVCLLPLSSMATDMVLSAECSDYNIAFEVEGAVVESGDTLPDGNGGIVFLDVRDARGTITVTPVFTENQENILGTDPENIVVDLDEGLGEAQFDVIFADPDIPNGTWIVDVVDLDYIGDEPGDINGECINVYMTFVNHGEIVVQDEQIEVFDADGDGEYNIGDAFRALHRKHYPSEESGYKEISGNGVYGWVSKFWGTNDTTFCYSLNRRWAKSTKDVICDGDMIAAIIGDDDIFFSDLYTWFEESSYYTGVGESTTLKVNGLNLMASSADYDALYAPHGATVTVCNEFGEELTDMTSVVADDGTCTLNFAESGNYTVRVSGQAAWGSYIEAPVAPSTCEVYVSEFGYVEDDSQEIYDTDWYIEEENSDNGNETISSEESDFTTLFSDWPQFLGTCHSQGISSGETAVRAEDLKLRWKKNTGNTWCDVPGTPIVVGKYVYYYSSQYLRKLDLATGREMAKVQVYGDSVNQFFVNISYGDGKIFVPCQKDNLDDGLDIKGCFLRVYSAETLTQLYVTESLGSGQFQSPIMYNDGYFVTGVYGRNGIYACFTSEDEDTMRSDEVKKMAWSVPTDSKYGYSFNGACFVGDYCYFGCNNVLSVVNYKSGNVRSFDIGEGHRISSTIVYSSETQRLYVASNHPDNHAAVFSYKLGYDGMPVENTALKWISDTQGGGTQSTPVIYKGRLYLGGGGHTMGSNEPFHVLDAATLKKIYSVPLLTKASAAVSTAYACRENNWRVYIYMVPYAPNANALSELWIISDSQGQTEAKYEIAQNIGRSQYCSQSIVVTSDGALIWYNDGGYLYCYENKALALLPKKQSVFSRISHMFSQF